MTEATADKEAQSVEAHAAEATAAATEKPATSVDDPTNVRQSDDMTIAGEVLATAASTEDTESVVRPWPVASRCMICILLVTATAMTGKLTGTKHVCVQGMGEVTAGDGSAVGGVRSFPGI